MVLRLSIEAKNYTDEFGEFTQANVSINNTIRFAVSINA